MNLYYIFGMLVSDILFGMTLGNFFHFIIEAGNGRQIIPAILVTMLTYVYSIFSNIFNNNSRYNRGNFFFIGIKN